MVHPKGLGQLNSSGVSCQDVDGQLVIISPDISILSFLMFASFFFPLIISFCSLDLGFEPRTGAFQGIKK